MENAPFEGRFFLNKTQIQTLIQRKETNMNKTFLAIMGSVVIAWTLATISDSQAGSIGTCYYDAGGCKCPRGYYCYCY